MKIKKNIKNQPSSYLSYLYSKFSNEVIKPATCREKNDKSHVCIVVEPYRNQIRCKRSISLNTTNTRVRRDKPNEEHIGLTFENFFNSKIFEKKTKSRFASPKNEINLMNSRAELNPYNQNNTQNLGSKFSTKIFTPLLLFFNNRRSTIHSNLDNKEYSTSVSSLTSSSCLLSSSINLSLNSSYQRQASSHNSNLNHTNSASTWRANYDNLYYMNRRRSSGCINEIDKNYLYYFSLDASYSNINTYNFRANCTRSKHTKLLTQSESFKVLIQIKQVYILEDFMHGPCYCCTKLFF
jgi:hypothetical protein